MTPFDLAEPTLLKDALALLDPEDATVRPIGGGTALMLMMKAGVFRPTRLVSLPLAEAPLGEQELVLTVRDEISGRTFEAREPFGVDRR